VPVDWFVVVVSLYWYTTTNKSTGTRR